jgi:hypothetical protein
VGKCGFAAAGVVAAGEGDRDGRRVGLVYHRTARVQRPSPVDDSGPAGGEVVVGIAGDQPREGSKDPVGGAGMAVQPW